LKTSTIRMQSLPVAMAAVAALMARKVEKDHEQSDAETDSTRDIDSSATEAESTLGADSEGWISSDDEGDDIASSVRVVARGILASPWAAIGSRLSMALRQMAASSLAEFEEEGRPASVQQIHARRTDPEGDAVPGVAYYLRASSPEHTEETSPGEWADVARRLSAALQRAASEVGRIDEERVASATSGPSACAPQRREAVSTRGWANVGSRFSAVLQETAALGPECAAHNEDIPASDAKLAHGRQSPSLARAADASADRWAALGCRLSGVFQDLAASLPEDPEEEEEGVLRASRKPCQLFQADSGESTGADGESVSSIDISDRCSSEHAGV